MIDQQVDLGPLPDPVLAIVENKSTLERQVSDHGIAYYGKNWTVQTPCFSAEQMRFYAREERAAERARCAAICAELATSTASMFASSHDAKNANAVAMMCHDKITNCKD